MAPRTDFPPVRACLFDMDGLLIDTEDIYTACINRILERYSRPPLPWSVKARLQGRPGPQANEVFHAWAQLPISPERYADEYAAAQREMFPRAKPLPGVEQLLARLDGTRAWEEAAQTQGQGQGQGQTRKRVHVALATSSNKTNYALKTGSLGDLFSFFPEERKVMGDDERIPRGRGKPLPDIYLLSLRTVNETLAPGEEPIRPEECLVFEDSVPGVEAGRRAGMRVVWVPHAGLKKEYEGREREVLAGRTGEAGDVDMHQVGELDDGWADYYETLEGFPYEKYGIELAQ